jgi:hypothetical protein
MFFLTALSPCARAETRSLSREAIQLLGSDLVLAGRLFRVSPTGNPKDGSRVYLHVRGFKLLKGEWSDYRRADIPIAGWVESSRPDIFLTRSHLDDVAGKNVLMFAVKVDANRPQPELHLYQGSQSVQVQNARAIAPLRAEIAHQARLLSDFAQAPYAQPDETDRTVKQQLDALADSRLAEDAVGKLVSMGCGAVPALVRQMDDRRPFAADEIALENRSPGALEGVRVYSPELIVDAIAAILNHLSGETFGFIYNGASAALRERTVDKWRTWLALVDGHPACP